MKNLDDYFPYTKWKPQQKEASEFISDVINDKEIGILEAYCGFGKTIVTLLPSVLKGKKLIVLSPNYRAKESVVSEVLKINSKKKIKLKLCDLRGKKNSCNFLPKEGKRFSYLACKIAVKYEKDCEYYYNLFPEGGGKVSRKGDELIRNINYNVLNNPEFFASGGNIHKKPDFYNKFHTECENTKLCTYNSMKELMKTADVIILDHFWVFSSIFFQLIKNLKNKNISNYVLLVDEADMLIPRLYNTYLSSSLSMEGLRRVNHQLEQISKKPDNDEDIKFNKNIKEILISFLQKNKIDRRLNLEDCISFFEEKNGRNMIEIEERYRKIIERISDAEDYERVITKPDSFFNRLSNLNTKKNLFYMPSTTKLQISPFELKGNYFIGDYEIEDVLKKFPAVIFFSGTIGDPKLFCAELGIPEKKYVFRVSKMNNPNIKVIIDKSVTSVKRTRKNSYKEYTKRIKTIIDSGVNSLYIGTVSEKDEYIGVERIIEELFKYGIEANKTEDMKGIEKRGVYVSGINTRHGRSTNIAKNLLCAYSLGLPHPATNFFYQEREKYLKNEYGSEKTRQLTKGQAIKTTLQFIGRIRPDRDKKLIILGDRRFIEDDYDGSFYFDNIPQYLKENLSIVKSNEELEKEIKSFLKNV